MLGVHTEIFHSSLGLLFNAGIIPDLISEDFPLPEYPITAEKFVLFKL